MSNETTDADPAGKIFVGVLVVASFILIALGEDIGWLLMGVWMGRMS